MDTEGEEGEGGGVGRFRALNALTCSAGPRRSRLCAALARRI